MLKQDLATFSIWASKDRKLSIMTPKFLADSTNQIQEFSAMTPFMMSFSFTDGGAITKILVFLSFKHKKCSLIHSDNVAKQFCKFSPSAIVSNEGMNCSMSWWSSANPLILNFVASIRLYRDRI